MAINWYPGHMKKTRDLITQHLKLVDVVVEVLDARIPVSSRNPQFDDLVGNLPRVVVLNKYDLADESALKEWIQYYRQQGIRPVQLNALSGDGLNRLVEAIKEAGSAKAEKMKAKGLKLIAVKCMILGIPNVGKSSVINKLVGKKSAKTGNKPGVTRGKQWVRIRDDIELFDTPGILWPRIDDAWVGSHLAMTGAIRDEVYEHEAVVLELVRKLTQRYPEPFKARYKLAELPEDPMRTVELIAAKRGCLKPGGIADTEKAEWLIMDEFRKGLIGRISLELPQDLLDQEQKRREEKEKEKAQKEAEKEAALSAKSKAEEKSLSALEE